MSAQQDFDEYVALIAHDNAQMGNADHIPNWHFHFKLRPTSQGGSMSGSNVIKADPMQRYLLTELQTRIYPNDKTLGDHFKLLKDESFATCAEEYELFKAPVKLQWEIDQMRQAVAEHRDGACDYGYEDTKLTALFQRMNAHRTLLTQVLELIAEKARVYKPILKAFPKPLAPHLAAMDREFEQFSKALNPTWRVTESLGTEFRLPGAED